MPHGGQGLKKELFGYLPGGYARILKRFGEVLAETGVTVELGDRITQVEQTASGQLSLQFHSGKICYF